ncbi:MAG: hypothetical protein H6867_05975 [Rhodospirillales bacterium]|nr:hypothetical protein [Rhodospirillales bacterium]
MIKWQSLKEIWNKIQTSVDKILTNCEHGPFWPAPDVRAELEKQGYKFEDKTVITMPGFPLPTCNVTTPDGIDLGKVMPPKGTLEKYREDYYAAVETCSKRPPEPQQGPKL